MGGGACVAGMAAPHVSAASVHQAVRCAAGPPPSRAAALLPLQDGCGPDHEDDPSFITSYSDKAGGRGRGGRAGGGRARSMQQGGAAPPGRGAKRGRAQDGCAAGGALGPGLEPQHKRGAQAPPQAHQRWPCGDATNAAAVLAPPGGGPLVAGAAGPHGGQRQGLCHEGPARGAWGAPVGVQGGGVRQVHVPAKAAQQQQQQGTVPQALKLPPAAGCGGGGKWGSYLEAEEDEGASHDGCEEDGFVTAL